MTLLGTEIPRSPTHTELTPIELTLTPAVSMSGNHLPIRSSESPRGTTPCEASGRQFVAEGKNQKESPVFSHPKVAVS